MKAGARVQGAGWGRVAFLALGVALSVGVPGGCQSSVEERRVRLDLVLRGSCGRSTRSYDTSCIASLDVQVRDLYGNLLKQQCTPIPGRYATMNDVIASTDVLEVLSDVSAKESRVKLELRAYHAFDRPACQGQSQSELMIWGSSELFDLAARDRTELAVYVECRPECDCQAFDPPNLDCPPALPQGACAPLEFSQCRRHCVTDQDCYDGQLDCEGSICEPLHAGGLCGACEHDAECDSGMCIQNINTNESFCAEPCPSDATADPCPPLMSCKRLGNGVFERLP